jgi:hypothetical protein
MWGYLRIISFKEQLKTCNSTAREICKWIVIQRVKVVVIQMSPTCWFQPMLVVVSLGVLVAPPVQNVSRKTWRFQHKLLFHNLHKVSWSGFDGGELLLRLLLLVILLQVFKLLLQVHVTLSPCSSWSCYVPCPCCHGFVAHDGLDVMVLLLIMDLLLAMVLFLFLLFMFLVLISIYTLLGPALVGDMHFCINFFGRFTISNIVSHWVKWIFESLKL